MGLRKKFGDLISSNIYFNAHWYSVGSYTKWIFYDILQIYDTYFGTWFLPGIINFSVFHFYRVHLIDYNDESEDDDATAPRGEHEIDNGKHEADPGETEAKNHYQSLASSSSTVTCQ